MNGPFTPVAARSLIRRILEEGRVVFSKHARQEMQNDELTAVDINNVLRAGIIDEPEYENGSWRYKVWTLRITVVVALRSQAELVVVTTWRHDK